MLSSDNTVLLLALIELQNFLDADGDPFRAKRNPFRANCDGPLPLCFDMS